MQGIQHVQGGTADQTVVKNESKVVSNTVTVHSFQLIFNAVCVYPFRSCVHDIPTDVLDQHSAAEAKDICRWTCSACDLIGTHNRFQARVWGNGPIVVNHVTAAHKVILPSALTS